MEPRASGSRRDFLKTTGAVMAGALASELAIARAAHPGGSDLLRVGLIGCGGRGTGAAADALRADANVKLVAMADAFADRLESSLAGLGTRPELAGKIAVDPERRFVGLDAYQKLLESGVDVVLLAEPPYFRPSHLKAAVAAGKHVFAEKPVAVDAPGVRDVLDSVEEARRRGLSIVSGLCWRYHNGVRETVRRLHDGAIGDVVALHGIYNANGLWKHDRQEGWSDLEWQLRNWIYFTWLSGDIIAEQHIHTLDKMAWVLKDAYPERATGTGGRQVRCGPEYGYVYDHFAVAYEFPEGVRGFSFCRQQDGCTTDVSDHVLGTSGRANLLKHRIEGDERWVYKGPPESMYQNEMDALFAAIRAGEPINDGVYMARSTLMAIMGRMSAYTGKTITWEQALASKERLGPEQLSFEAPLPVEPVAMPGITPFE